MKHKFSILNTSRWESTTIVEWVLYYRSIGFDHIYIYCNDDSPEEMYQVLLPFITGPSPSVTFHHLPYQGQQDYCWTHFLVHHKDETEWFMFVDADEFLVLRDVDNINQFMKGREDRYDSINFGWVWFGPMDFIDRPGGSTLLQFTRRQDHTLFLDKFTKSLNRSSKIDASLISRPPPQMLNHLWPNDIQRNLRSVDVLGYPFASLTSDFPDSVIKYLERRDIRAGWFDTAILYHYVIRSRNDMLRRVQRGLKGAYWFQTMWTDTYNSEGVENYICTLNAVEDRYLYEYWSRRLNDSEKTRIVEPSRFTNVAPLSTPLQSSTCIYSSDTDPAINARRAINGDYTGEDGFHTDHEVDPWWMTQLDQTYLVKEIRLFNSLKTAEIIHRTLSLDFDISGDGVLWRTIHRKRDGIPFGGVDGSPYIVRLNEITKFVRVRLIGKSWFQLDQIEIFVSLNWYP